MKSKRRSWLIAGMVLVVVAVGIGAYFCLRPPPAQRLATVLAEVAPPAPPAPAPGSPPAPASPLESSSTPPASSGPLEEKQFIEVSATILMRVAQIQDRPDAQEIIPALMERTLQDAGVTEEQFEAAARRVYADPAHSKQVGDAILKRVEQRSTPEMRVRVAGLAEAMAQRQRTQPPPDR